MGAEAGELRHITATGYPVELIERDPGTSAISGSNYCRLMRDTELAIRHDAADLDQVSKLGFGAISLIAANATLLLLYFWLDLTLFQVVLVYWLECLWVGVYCALKLLVASAFGDPYENSWAELSGGANFLMSILALGYLGAKFLILFTLLGFGISFAYDGLTGLDAADVFTENFRLLLGSSGVFLAGHGLSFVVNFLILGEFRAARVGTLLWLPIGRCLALLAAIILAFGVAYVVPGLASATGFAILVIILKLYWDYRLHQKERASFARARNNTEQLASS